MRRATVAAGRHARRQGAEQGDYFASMTDLMLGLVFVFIIMLMGFVLNLHEAAPKIVDTTVKPVEQDLARREMLRDIAKILEGILPVTVDEDNGTLQLGGDVLFPKGSADAYPEAMTKLRILGFALDRVLPCYAVTTDSRPLGQCANKHRGRLDAVYIEGHTDTTPIHTARFQNNWELSAARASATFGQMVLAYPGLENLANDKGEKLIGVSGYGEYRPIDGTGTEAGMQKNRRIELRFVMTAPGADAHDDVAAQVKASAAR